MSEPKTPLSPRVRHLSWGRIETDEERYKDAKLYPGGSRAWDWNETGTRHNPGIQPADVEELLDRGADVVILSRGMQERLQVMEETIELLEEAGVELHVLQTEEAVAKYNELCEQAAVGGLFHSTC